MENLKTILETINNKEYSEFQNTNIQEKYSKIEEISDKKLLEKISEFSNLSNEIIFHLLENRNEKIFYNLITLQSNKQFFSQMMFLSKNLNMKEVILIIKKIDLTHSHILELLNYQVRNKELRNEENFFEKDLEFNNSLFPHLMFFRETSKEEDLSLYKPSLLIIELINEINNKEKSKYLISLLENYISIFTEDSKTSTDNLEKYINNLIEHYKKIALKSNKTSIQIDTATIREEILFYISAIINKEELFKEELEESIKDEYIELDLKLLKIKNEILNNKTISDIKNILEDISENFIFGPENKNLLFEISILFWKDLENKELPVIVINDFIKLIKSLKMKDGKYLRNFENFYYMEEIYKLIEDKLSKETDTYMLKLMNNFNNDKKLDKIIKKFTILHNEKNKLKKDIKKELKLNNENYELLVKLVSNEINDSETIKKKVNDFISRDIKEPAVSWNEIIGLSKVKTKLKEISKLFSLTKKELEEYKIKKQKGFILYGPPGVGKTMLCEAFAKDIGGLFIYKSMNELISYFKDNEMNGQSKIKFLYENLISTIGDKYNNVPIVVFLDEIDSIRARGESAHNNSYYDGITNDFLFAIDQVKNKHNIITIGATNSRDNLDKAIIRNGRLGIQIEIKNNFTKKEVYNFIKKELKGMKNISNKSCKLLSEFCYYRDGNEINEILNNFKFKTLIKNGELNKHEIVEIVYETVYELDDFSNISRKDKKETAYHEAGHAYFTKALNKKTKINEVTIYPTKFSLGYVKASNNSVSQSKEDLENQVIVLLAGRYAESLITNNLSAGASSDLVKANEIIHKLIMKYGMIENHLNLVELKGKEYKDLSEYQKTKIDKETDIILKRLSEKTKQLVNENKLKIERIAKKLIKESVIFDKDIEV